jgi:hypothetical protein
MVYTNSFDRAVSVAVIGVGYAVLAFLARSADSDRTEQESAGAAPRF